MPWEGESHVGETPGPGRDGDDAGEDQRHQGEAPQAGAGDQSQSSRAESDQSQRDLERLCAQWHLTL